MLCIRNNTDGNKLVIFSSTALYYDDSCMLSQVRAWSLLLLKETADWITRNTGFPHTHIMAPIQEEKSPSMTLPRCNDSIGGVVEGKSHRVTSIHQTIADPVVYLRNHNKHQTTCDVTAIQVPLDVFVIIVIMQLQSNW